MSFSTLHTTHSRVSYKFPLLKIGYNHLINYPTPLNLNYSWNFGSLAGIMLASQMITGILLAMHYVGHVDMAFASVQRLMTDVPNGCIIRYAHANGASLFFIVVYIHVLRGIYYNSGNQPREIVWISGIVILLAMIITAFIGYVLVWGQDMAQNILNSLNLEIDFSYIKKSLKSLKQDLALKEDVLIFYILSTKQSIYCLQKENIKDIMAISVGTLLGDAHCEKRGNARLTIKQSILHKEWFDWLHKFYVEHGLCSDRKPQMRVLKSGYKYYKFNTYTNNIFNELHSLFYIKKDSKNVKYVNLEIYKYFEPKTLATWLCDDGTVRNGNSAFCTDSFSPNCIENLIYIVKSKFDINLIPYKHYKKYTRLQVDRKDMFKFVNLIKEHLHPSMHYKLGDFKV